MVYLQELNLELFIPDDDALWVKTEAERENST
jgi:hypothetical protein